jgi:CBS domain-containing protein
MKVSECMSKDVQLATPTETVREAAGKMRKIDAGVLPVEDNDRLVGMITDRDIALRTIGEGKGPDTHVGDVMSKKVRYCFDDEELEAVSRQMGEFQVRRLPVLNREKRLGGILSLGDVSHADDKSSAKALRDISKPGGVHSQK